MTQTIAPPALRNPWWVVFGSTVGLIVGNGPIVFFTFGLFLLPVTREFGWDRATFSSSLLVGHAMAALAYPFLGRAIDRYGVRRVSMTSIVLFAASIASLSLTPPSPAVFIAMAGLCGLLSAGQAPLPYAKAVSSWFDDRRGLALGIAMTGIGIGATFVPQFARAVIAAYGWRTGYVALGALMLAVALPAVAIFIREPDARTRALAYSDGIVPGMTVGESLRTSSFWLLAVPVFLVVTTINGIVGHLVPLLTDRGLELRQATATLSVVGLSTIAGRLVSGYLLDRYFAPLVTAVLFLLPLAGVTMLALGAGGATPMLAAMSLGFGLGAEIDVIGFMVSRYFGLRAYGEVYGCMFAIFTVGTGLGPVLMGLSFDATGSYAFTLTMFGMALVVASLLVSRLGRYTFPAIGHRR
jgi:predicted MFS family arabinose efflux permease